MLSLKSTVLHKMTKRGQTAVRESKSGFLSFRYHQKYMLRQRPSLLKSLGLNDEELKKSRVAARLNGYVGGFGSLKSFEAEVDKLKLSEAQADLVKEIIGRKKF